MGRVLGLAMAVATLACSDSITPFDEPVFLIEGATSFELVNLTTHHEVGYVALTAQNAPLVLLAPCEAWPRIRPRGHATIQHEDVIGYQGPGTDSALIHWCALANGGIEERGTLEAPL